MNSLTHKRCTKCGELKPFSGFYKDNTKPDKLTANCKDCQLARSISYYRDNAEERREYVRNKRAKNPLENVLQSIRYYWAHAEERKQYRRDYVKAHPEINRQNVKNRKAKLRGVGGSFTAQEWEDLKCKYDYTCLRCKRREPEIKLTRDHVKPIELGGTNSIDNIQPLCHSCNSSKKKQEIDYRWL